MQGLTGAVTIPAMSLAAGSLIVMPILDDVIGPRLGQFGCGFLNKNEGCSWYPQGAIPGRKKGIHPSTTTN